MGDTGEDSALHIQLFRTTRRLSFDSVKYFYLEDGLGKAIG